ncbi:MAG: Nif3-like dinuclear metal center hexameric protein [Treponema sp.]|jgi:dinuclear metal center YbgI/SA1388 family protein|nr:Nif3-like dinuclear metal center hexameric protein [Treponema sp.]
MTLTELSLYFQKNLCYENYINDISQNGLQITVENEQNFQVKKIGFAVDACESVANEAVNLGCDVLFVHHGYFWGHEQTLTGSHFRRVFPFLKNNVALYAAHIPLDANKTFGNNFGLAKMLGMKKCVEFGTWRDMNIGVKGELKKEFSLEDLVQTLQKTIGDNILTNKIQVLNFGKGKVKTIGIISGGAGKNVVQAIEQGLDCYITGEIGHENFHVAKEGKINVIGLGHYASETIGLKLLMEKVVKECKIETVFIDFPTGL